MKKDQNLSMAVKATFHRDHKGCSFVYKLVNPSKEVTDLLDELAKTDSLGFRHKETEGDKEVYVFYKKQYLCSPGQVINMSLTLKDGRVGFWIAGSQVDSKITTLTGLVESTPSEKVANALAQRGVDQILAMAGLLANTATPQALAPQAQPAQEQPAQDANMSPE